MYTSDSLKPEPLAALLGGTISTISLARSTPTGYDTIVLHPTQRDSPLPPNARAALLAPCLHPDNLVGDILLTTALTLKEAHTFQ